MTQQDVTDYIASLRTHKLGCGCSHCKLLEKYEQTLRTSLREG